jgi:hypothetical protein
VDANEDISTGEIMYVYFSLVMVQNGAKAQHPHSDNAHGRYWTAFMPITHYPNQGRSIACSATCSVDMP